MNIIYYIRDSFTLSQDKENTFYNHMYYRIRGLRNSINKQIAYLATNFIKNEKNTTVPTLQGLAKNSPVDYFSSTNPNNISNSKKQLSDLDTEEMQRYKKNSLKFASDAYKSLHSTLKIMLKYSFFEKKGSNFKCSDFNKIQQLISIIPQFLELYKANTVVYHNLDMCKLENDISMADYVKQLNSFKMKIPLLALFYIFIECCYYAHSTFGFLSVYFNDTFDEIKELILEMNNTTDNSNDNSEFVNNLSKCLGTIKKNILQIMLSSKIVYSKANLSANDCEAVSSVWSDYLSKIVPQIRDDISSLSNTTDPIFSNIISTARLLMHLKEYFYEKYPKLTN